MTGALAATPLTRKFITEEDLVASGFTAEQVEQLEAVSVNYPIAELFDSDRELNRILFLKWLNEQGVLSDEVLDRAE